METILQTLGKDGRDLVKSFKEPICVRRMKEFGWKILLDEENKPFFDMEKAIAFVRRTKALSSWGTELGKLTHARQDFSVWDNF